MQWLLVALYWSKCYYLKLPLWSSMSWHLVSWLFSDRSRRCRCKAAPILFFAHDSSNVGGLYSQGLQYRL
jgi:hypothetical protein